MHALVVISDESKQVDKAVATSGGKLKVKKAKITNSAAAPGPCLLMYLKTLTRF